MSDIETSTFELTGGRQGQTLSWQGKFSFVDGMCTIRAGREQMSNIRRYLAANLQAKETKHDASQPQQRSSGPADAQGAGQHAVQGGGAAAAEALPPRPGATQEGGPQDDPVLSKIRLALLQMDGQDDDLWTKDGLPKLSAVEKLAGTGAVTRAQLQAASPGFTRQSAN